MNVFCPTVNPCGDFTAPYANLSAEAPDSNPFIGISYGDPQSKPPLGSDWFSWSCLGFCDSTVSQTAANQCAANNQLICLSSAGTAGGGSPGDGFGGAGGGGLGMAPAQGSNVGPFGGTTGTPGNPITGSGVFPFPPGQAGNALFSSAPVSCMATCPDGTQQKYTLPAGYVVAASQVMADRQAASLCAAVAQQNLVCFSPIKPFMCLMGEPDSIKPSVYTLSGGGTAGDWTFPQFGGPPNYLPQGFTVNQIGPTSCQLVGSAAHPGNLGLTIQAVRKNPPLTLTVNDTLSVLGIDDSAFLVLPAANCDVGGYEVTLPEAPYNQQYSQTLQSQGGVGPYTYKFTGLPQWLTASGATVSGMPKDTDAGITYLFDITITDSATPKPHTCSCCGKVIVPCSIVCTDPVAPGVCPPDGTICVDYHCTFQAVPNLLGTTYGGLLPAGLKINANTGVVTGKPCSVGPAVFELTALLPNGGTCKNTFKSSIADDGTGIVSAIKDLTWTWYQNQPFGTGDSTMKGASGVITAKPTEWKMVLSGGVYVCQSFPSQIHATSALFRNCCGQDYTAHVVLDWSLPDVPCTHLNPNPPPPTQTLHPTGQLNAGTTGGYLVIQSLNAGGGTFSFDVLIPSGAGNHQFVIDAVSYAGSPLTVNVTITPPTPP